MNFRFLSFLLLTGTALGQDAQNLLFPQEKHLKNMRQLTFGGENAEAYWSFNNDQLVFQRTDPAQGILCDQIFIWSTSGNNMNTHAPIRVSNGEGRTTCSYFLKGDSLVVYASTHAASPNCPPEPERTSGAYYWPIYPSFDLYIKNLRTGSIKQITNRVGYDAEATVSPRGDKIVFTSDRSGDLELWTMDIDGGNLKQITRGLGYDGGAFFSPDGSHLVFRASRPKSPEEIEKYTGLFKKGLVAPSDMEIYTCKSDGTELRQVTRLGKANWAPFFHPSGNKILFSSNHASQRGYQFNLYMVNLDGSGLEQITFDPVFDAFPMFSFDGKKLVFSSNRNNGGTRSTNLFIADWID
jgi:Tol biopolymer transport system component